MPSPALRSAAHGSIVLDSRPRACPRVLTFASGAAGVPAQASPDEIGQSRSRTAGIDEDCGAGSDAALSAGGPPVISVIDTALSALRRIDQLMTSARGAGASQAPMLVLQLGATNDADGKVDGDALARATRTKQVYDAAVSAGRRVQVMSYMAPERPAELAFTDTKYCLIYAPSRC